MLLSRKRIVLPCAATAALGIAVTPAATAKGNDSHPKKDGLGR